MSRTVGLLVSMFATAAFGCEEPATARDPTTAITPLPLSAIVLERGRGRPDHRIHSGRPVLLHFWATWCAPCRRELPALLEAAQATSDVTVVAVTEEDWVDVEQFFGVGGVPPWVARDPGGELRRTLGGATLPETYLLDATLVATRRVAGPVSWGDHDVRAWMRTIAVTE